MSAGPRGCANHAASVVAHTPLPQHPRPPLLTAPEEAEALMRPAGPPGPTGPHLCMSL